MPQDVWYDLTRNNPHHATHTMSTTEPATNRLATNAQTSSSGNYEADLARMRADLNTLLGTKLSQLGIDPGRNQLYQRPYPMLTIWFLILRGGTFPILLNLVGTIIGQFGST